MRKHVFQQSVGGLPVRGTGDSKELGEEEPYIRSSTIRMGARFSNFLIQWHHIGITVAQGHCR